MTLARQPVSNGSNSACSNPKIGAQPGRRQHPALRQRGRGEGLTLVRRLVRR